MLITEDIMIFAKVLQLASFSKAELLLKSPASKIFLDALKRIRSD